MRLAQLFAPPVWWSLLSVVFTLLLPVILLASIVTLVLTLIQKLRWHLVTAARTVFVLGLADAALLALWHYQLGYISLGGACVLLAPPMLASLAWWRAQAAMKMLQRTNA